MTETIDLRKIISLVYDAGYILKNFYEQSLIINFKGPRDLVTEADITVEKFLKDALFSLYPKVEFLGEESSVLEKKMEAFILDPLDGTTNFAHHVPAFCISLAYVRNYEIELGVIYDPLKNEMFFAETGKGAFLNDKPISVSKTEKLQKSLIATGFPYADDTVAKSLNYFNHILPFCQGVRRMGAAALDLAYTASGRFDGFFELNLKPWDVAAGILIVRESGGMATDLKGIPSTPYDNNIAASNGFIHGEILKNIEKADGNLKNFSDIFKGFIIEQN